MRVGGCTPSPFLSTITSKVVVYAPAERAATLPLFLLYPYMYSVVHSELRQTDRQAERYWAENEIWEKDRVNNDTTNFLFLPKHFVIKLCVVQEFQHFSTQTCYVLYILYRNHSTTRKATLFATIGIGSDLTPFTPWRQWTQPELWISFPRSISSSLCERGRNHIIFVFISLFVSR